MDTLFERHLKRVFEFVIGASDFGLRDFGFFSRDRTHDLAEYFDWVRARCQEAELPLPYGYRYRQAHLSEEERVVTSREAVSQGP